MATLTEARPEQVAPAPSRMSLLLRGRHANEDPVSADTGQDLTGPIVMLMSLGLLVHGVAAVVGRRGAGDPTTDNVFWISLLLVVVPAAARIVHRNTGARELTALALALPVMLAISREMLYPTQFVYHDEMAHGNTLRQINESHHLFSYNTLLPVSGFYPGLEIVTDGVQDLTGLAPHASAVVVLITARVVMALAVFGIIGLLTQSTRGGAVGTLLYACNPQFLFFNSQFSYQTLALPLGIAAVYLVLRQDPARRRPSFLALAAVAGVAVTHHMTSFLLVGALIAWFGLALVVGDRSISRPALGTVLAAALVSVLTWAFVPGNPVSGYLLAIYENAVGQVGELTQGQQSHVLFSDFSGDKTPPWQQGALIAAIVVTGLLLLPGLWQCRIWWRHRVSTALLLCAGAFIYPLIPLGHLTFATSEVFDRSSGFVYLGVAFVLTCLFLVYQSRESRMSRAVPVTALVALLFVGGIILGSGPRWNRVPGPYLVAADPRSVDAYNLAAARWLEDNAPHNSRVLGDRIGRMLAAEIGAQDPVTYLGDEVNVSGLLLAPTIERQDRVQAARIGLRYVVVDRRLSQSLPRVGVYYENGEWGSLRTDPVSEAALTKLDGAAGVTRIYDNGAVAIYDVRDLPAG